MNFAVLVQVHPEAIRSAEVPEIQPFFPPFPWWSTQSNVPATKPFPFESVLQKEQGDLLIRKFANTTRGASLSTAQAGPGISPLFLRQLRGHLHTDPTFPGAAARQEPSLVPIFCLGLALDRL